MRKIIGFFASLMMGLSISSAVYSKTLDYTLTINEQKIKITDSTVTALTLNGSLPGPTLTATVGDFLRIAVKNNLDQETSIHWHGVLVPNRMDGVPSITSPPIKPGETFFYEFPVKHSGTYWYHAHSGLQEQQGIYGALVFHPKEDVKDHDEEHVVVLSDWTNEPPNQVLSNLKKDPDYYALKKDAVQSWFKVLSNGSEALQLRLNNAFNKMSPMDLSDVGYDAFLINGHSSIHLSRAKAGRRVKLRIINAAASSYLILEYSGGPMRVIEVDGNPIQPLTAKRIRMAMAETYDVIVSLPENKTYEFRASAEDGTGFASARIGSGTLVQAASLPKPNLVLMKHEGHGSMGEMHNMSHRADAGKASNKVGMDHATHSGMKIESMEMGSSNAHPNTPHMDYLNHYKALKSSVVTTLTKNRPSRVVVLKLTGSMERYVWTINNKPMYAADRISIKKGENVKFVLVNETMMHHPIHVHGHFFRVLNGQGDHSPLKHTVNVAPFETVQIEFEANEEKDWIFHCHNLYHLTLGMGGVIHYVGTLPDLDVRNHAGDHSADHGNQWFNATHINGFSNLAMGAVTFMRNDDNFILDAWHNYKKEYESEMFYKRYVSQFLGVYVGGDFEKEEGRTSNTAILGVEYTLPFLIKSDFRGNSHGKFRFGLHNDHSLTDRLSFEWSCNTDEEYRMILDYAVSKQLYISGNYDSREKFGLGFGLKL